MSFYLPRIKTEKGKWQYFLKERYGTGGCSHALDGADDSHADYNGKGLKLARGKFWKPGYAGTIEMAAGSEEGNVSD